MLTCKTEIKLYTDTYLTAGSASAFHLESHGAVQAEGTFWGICSLHIDSYTNQVIAEHCGCRRFSEEMSHLDLRSWKDAAEIDRMDP